MTNRWLVRLLAIGVSALAARAYATVTWPACLLGWIAFVPWLLTCDRDRTARDACGSGLLMAIAFTIAVFDWFATAIHAYTGYPQWSVLLALALCAPVLQPQFVVYALLRQRRQTRSAWRAASLAGGYVGTEWLLGKLLGDTWGHGQYASPVVRQVADLGGATGLTFALLLVNDAVATIVQRARCGATVRGWALGVTCVVASLHAYGLMRLADLDRPQPALATVALVQASLGDYGALRAERGTYEAVRAILQAHVELSRQAVASAAGLDVVVWPETAYPTTFGTPKSADGAAFDREITTFTAEIARPLILGTYDAANDAEYNAATFLRPTGEHTTYRKTQLFPLVERVPAWLDGPTLRHLLPWLGTWTPGAGPRVIELAGRDGHPLRLAPMICYDAVAPAHALAAVRAGADAFVTLSNDGWFGRSEGAHLHFVVSAFRSIETRRAQVRATNSGISAIITPTGAVTAIAGVGERTALVGTIAAPPRGSTVMVRLGDWVGPTGAVIALAGLIF